MAQARYMGWVELGPRESPGWSKSVSHVNGELRFGAVLLQDAWVGREFNKGTMSLSVLRFPERVALTPALCWRLERVGLSGSQSVRNHFKRSTLVSSSPLSWTQSLLWFRQPDVIGTPLPSSGVPCWEPGVTLGCLIPQGGPLQPRCPSRFLITTSWVWDLPILYLGRVTSLNMACSLYP